MEGEGALEFGFDDFRDCRDFEVIVRLVVGDIPRSVTGWYKGLGIGNSGRVGCWLAWLNLWGSTPLVHVTLRMDL